MRVPVPHGNRGQQFAREDGGGWCTHEAQQGDDEGGTQPRVGASDAAVGIQRPMFGRAVVTAKAARFVTVYPAR